ncbi:MAG: hypothetical protein AAF799_37720 [Myxococcota bacterium]
MLGSPLLLLALLAPPTGDSEPPASAAEPAPEAEGPQTDAQAPSVAEAEPEAPAQPPVESEPDSPQRDYEGPTAVDGPEPEPRPAPPLLDMDSPPRLEHCPEGSRCIELEPPAPEAEPTESSDGVMTIQPVPGIRTMPRVLSAIRGYPADEVAVLEKGRLRFQPGLQLRNQIGWTSDFPLDRTGEVYREGARTTGRLRWNPKLSWSNWLEVVGNVDFINGAWAPIGSTDPVLDEIIVTGQPPGHTQQLLLDPRELYATFTTPYIVIRAGQQSFTWGQGMLANDGNNVDRFGDMRFGGDSLGDIYERVLLATKPFAPGGGRLRDLVFAVGGDLVFRDERVQLTRGDLAGQALLVIRHDSSRHPGNSLGGYAVYRRQRTVDDDDLYPDDDDLEVGAFDLTGQGLYRVRSGFQLMGAFEGALIVGRTDNARDERGDHAVVQGGAVLRGYLGDHQHWLAGFDAGYASGDGNPDDRSINNFTFDAGHTVGLIMFNQVMGWRTARSEILANDPVLTGVPSNGTQFIPTRGGVSNALYVHPKARWAFRERLEVWGGPLVAAAPNPIVDPYAAQLNGGQPTTSLGGDGHRRYYGTELDLGLRGRFELDGLWLQAGLQGAVLFPGAGMANAQGEAGGPVGALWFRTEIRY